MSDCTHDRTEIWEPHLAGARRCLDCKMVYNPNYTPQWFFEAPSLAQQLLAEKALSAKLYRELNYAHCLVDKNLHPVADKRIHLMLVEYELKQDEARKTK